MFFVGFINIAPIVGLFLIFRFPTTLANFDQSIIKVDDGFAGASRNICSFYLPKVHELPDEAHADKKPIVDLTTWDGCLDSSSGAFNGINNTIVVINMTGECNFTQRLLGIPRKAGLEAIFIWNTTFSSIVKKLNSSEYPITFIDRNFSNISHLLGSQFRLDEKYVFNYSLIIIWILATFIVTVGSIWSSGLRHHLLTIEKDSVASNANILAETSSLPLKKAAAVSTLAISVVLSFLLLCYFFPDVLYYFVVVMFFVGSVFGLHTCLVCAVSRLCHLPAVGFRIRSTEFHWHSVVCLAVAVSVGVMWLVLMDDNPAGWVLQDLLGVAFTLSLIRSCHINSLSLIVCLSLGLLVYDIFFVFVTPLLTPDGRSIMVDVATRGGKGVLPMVLKVPRLVSGTYSICYHFRDFSLLGFGDIVIPGLIVSFFTTYDRFMRGKLHVYFAVANIGYAVGLIVTFVGLYLMQSAQPALIYLVPFTLLPCVVLARVRGDLVQMWRGTLNTDQLTPITDESSNSDEQ